jgi:hypothetical protein
MASFAHVVFERTGIIQLSPRAESGTES